MSKKQDQQPEKFEDPIFEYEEGGHRELVPAETAPLAMIRDYRPMKVRYILSQQNTAVGGPVGTYYNTFTGESATTLDVIPLHSQFMRIKQQENFGQTQCLSPNGKKSVSTLSDGRAPLYPSQECATCPLFSNSPFAHKQDKCEPRFVIRAFRPLTHEVVQMTVKRSNFAVGEYFGQPQSLRRRVIRLASGKEKNRGGKEYYIMLVRPQNFLDEEEKEFIQELAVQLNPVDDSASDSEAA
jgi:hypothetical protein